MSQPKDFLFLAGDLVALDKTITGLVESIKKLKQESSLIERDNQSTFGTEEGDFNPAESDLRVLERRYEELVGIRARAKIAPVPPLGIIGIGSVVDARKVNDVRSMIVLHVTGYQWEKESDAKEDKGQVFQDSRVVPVSYLSSVGSALIGECEGAPFTINDMLYKVVCVRNDAPRRSARR